MLCLLTIDSAVEEPSRCLVRATFREVYIPRKSELAYYHPLDQTRIMHSKYVNATNLLILGNL